MDEDEEKKIERLMGDLQFFADNFEHINGDQLGKRDEEAVRLRREKDDLRWKLAAEKRRSAELDKVGSVPCFPFLVFCFLLFSCY